ncbi:peptidyl-prolyl cis-trans isomerase B (cyclophilin B) [Clostridium saccharoperbutylacetonicum]|uniref:Peptidyl-prolyl cis-trans isomerase n=1 Tax=Clostridium saccharoperbutylacetonicum N1-4(HMT) TaxID=931276 RepID=M1MRX2_9CLOT|nr:peptidylprolyl isomerase [Clostridium saccharoperbutylacetonicum]AGF58908.1 peptidyl-prolyl cis-trans isomerase B [Clostridium saccharoperbutylacetonicum N1-4(HMT)]NRT60307.1 peptidyl-prolyl cis-trans isomerase B (cyclophilin B) [Clostridium saccharoperbutylacetonicum]NSB23619.1 peptidyl-prolyl cis-trans isomerase B (cyclophilin B) [Clostridium saccharoperbutylacetonicum]NSB42990.1 peptidyl-prolyl cis-trans isomerase B (cyclophilin B) [Clostridium saccharoperbutylacetonicum]
MKTKRYLSLFFITILTSLFMLMGCGNNVSIAKEKSNTESKASETSEKSSIEENKNLPIATITVNGYGVIKAELYPEIAPNTVNNFIDLANKNFYNNLKFHRVIKNFMIQGGDPKGDGTGGPGYSIEGEFTSNGFANSLKHTKGVLSMARTSDPNSAGSQFFIMSGDAANLDGEYAAFGKVISGLDVVDKIQNVSTNSADAPKEDVVITSITVDTRGVQYSEPKKK